jgi:hypothetical protein
VRIIAVTALLRKCLQQQRSWKARSLGCMNRPICWPRQPTRLPFPGGPVSRAILSLSKDDGDPPRLVGREHLGLPRLGFALSRVDVRDRLPVGVPARQADRASGIGRPPGTPRGHAAGTCFLSAFHQMNVTIDDPQVRDAPEAKQ